MTLSALARASTASSTVVLVTVPSILVASDGAIVPIPPNKTLGKDLFMATHYKLVSTTNVLCRQLNLRTMIYERIEPLTPINEPTVVRSGLSNIKPSATSAKPE